MPSLKSTLMGRLYTKVKILLKNKLLILAVCFISSNTSATKMAPISLEELLGASTIVATVNIKQASISTNAYKVIHSEVERFYLSYEATTVDAFKGDIRKLVAFLSREPLLVSREYLVF